MIFSVKRFLQFFTLITLQVIFFASCKSTKPPTSAPVKPPPPVVTPKPVPEKEDEASIESPSKMDVVLLMPFELKSNFNVPDEGIAEPEIKQSSLAALNFYEGARMAADSLNASGKTIGLTAIETPTDSIGIVRLFSNKSFKDAELVIASFQNALIPAAAAIAEKNGINLLLTQSSTPDFLEGRKNVALAYPSSVTQCKEVVAKLLQQFPGANIILVYRTVKREDELAGFFRSGIIKHKGTGEFKELNATQKGFADIVKYLSMTSRNLVFVVSSDEAFISPLLALIEEQNIYGIQVCGLPTWQNFESIDFMAFQNIQVNIFENNFIDYTVPRKIDFRKKFINRFYSDPEPSAFNGFDLVYNFGKNTGNTRTELSKMIKKSFDNADTGFRFSEHNSGGMENTNTSILRFTDYRLEIVPDR